MAGAPRVAERSDALAGPEAKRDHDTYEMKRAGVRPREQDSDLGRGLVLRWLINWDAGRRLGPTADKILGTFDALAEPEAK